MTTDQLPAPAVARRPGADATTVDTEPLSTALRRLAERRRDRARSLREWAREVGPELGRPLCRRAAELELAAVALELRADGMDGDGDLTPSPEEEER